MIEAWSVLPRSGTERLTLFDDGVLKIFGDCTSGVSTSVPTAQIWIQGRPRVEGATAAQDFQMGYAIEATSGAMYKAMHVSGLNEVEQSPWGSFTKAIQGVITTGLSRPGGYPLFISTYTDGNGSCNFRGWVIPERPAA